MYRKNGGRMVGCLFLFFQFKKERLGALVFKICSVGTNKLPDLVKSTDLVGTLTEQAAQDLGLPQQVQVFGGCDDTQSAALGTTAIGEGELIFM